MSTVRGTEIRLVRMEERLKAETRVLQTLLDGIEQARILQASEYARRLNDLNNSHERLDRIVSEVPSRDAFDTYLHTHNVEHQRIREQDDVWKRLVNKTLDEQRGANNRTAMLITIGLAVFSIALRLWPLG